MQPAGTYVGKCSKGPTSALSAMRTAITNGTIGTKIIIPLPDGKPTLSTVGACDECVEIVSDLLRKCHRS